jgi:hypothetical protein
MAQSVQQQPAASWMAEESEFNSRQRQETAQTGYATLPASCPIGSFSREGGGGGAAAMKRASFIQLVPR